MFGSEFTELGNSMSLTVQSSQFTKKVQVGKDQEKAQSEKDSHSKNPRWEKTN